MTYTVELPKASFDGGFATNEGWAVVYPADPVTLEYLGKPTMEYFMEGVTPAAFSYLDAPELVDGKAVIRDGDRWIHVEDHRGEIWWIKATKQEVEITVPGELSDEFTNVKPQQNEKWDGQGWVVDTDYVKAELAEAKGRIATDIISKSQVLRAKIALGSQTEEEARQMKALSAYMEAVNSVTVIDGKYTLPKAPSFLTR